MTVFSVVLTGGVFLLLILLLRRTQLAERGLELMTQLSGYSDRPYTVVQRRLLLLQNTLYSGVTDPDVLEKQYMVLSQYMHGLTLPSQRLNMMTEEIAADTDSLIQQWRNVLKPMLIFLIENPKNDSLREKVIDIADALEIGFFNLSTRNENARRIRERQWASNTRAVLYGMRQIFLSLAGTGVVVVLFVVFVIINISQFIREREIANQKLVFYYW